MYNHKIIYYIATNTAIIKVALRVNKTFKTN